MGILDLFRRQAGVKRVVIPINRAEISALGMKHIREWQCRCGAVLRIRARQDRGSGPSNFTPHPKGHKHAGHSQIPSEALTWDGLAEERGWKVEPSIVCPACQRGMTVTEYKEARRKGLL